MVQFMHRIMIKFICILRHIKICLKRRVSSLMFVFISLTEPTQQH